MRALGISFAVLLLVGCNIPKPDLSVFGASKVPPHGTGTYRTREEMNDSDYYNPTGTEPEKRSSRSRDDGQLLAIDITDSPTDSGNFRTGGSREILISRNPTSTARTRAASRAPVGIRAATRLRDDDDGFRAAPVRITRSSVNQVSYNEEVSENELTFVPLAAQLLVPDDETRRSRISDSTPADNQPGLLGDRTTGAGRLRSRDSHFSSHRSANERFNSSQDPTSTTIDGWTPR